MTGMSISVNDPVLLPLEEPPNWPTNEFKQIVLAQKENWKVTSPAISVIGLRLTSTLMVI
jgi:hypothetical protein